MNDTYQKLFKATIVLLIAFSRVESATVRDIFNLNADPLLRVPRDNKYFLDRYGSGSSRDDASSRTLKPEESPEARDAGTGTNVEKRCSGCDSSYPDYRDYRNPYDAGKYGSRYDTRGTRDRYDDRDLIDRYDNYYDRYDNRDRYYDRDRYDRRPDNYNYDRYDRDRYDTRDRYNNRDPYYDRSDRDRGFGYDNRGYDYRGYDNRNSYRPWDETYRGTSGWDNSGRGYYFATGRPEYSGGYGSGAGAGAGAGAGYASSWNYGRGDDRDYRNRDQGYPGTQYRPRDYYDYGYRGTSYLYARPSSSTTTSSSNPSDSDNSVTDTPRDSSPSDPIFFNIKSLPLKIIDKKSI